MVEGRITDVIKRKYAQAREQARDVVESFQTKAVPMVTERTTTIAPKFTKETVVVESTTQLGALNKIAGFIRELIDRITGIYYPHNTRLIRYTIPDSRWNMIAELPSNTRGWRIMNKGTQAIYMAHTESPGNNYEQIEASEGIEENSSPEAIYVQRSSTASNPTIQLKWWW